MAAGKVLGNAKGTAATDPIVRAIAMAETGTTAEIRVHLSKRLRERDPYGYALELFDRFGMSRTRQRNAVLVYVNLRRKRFAVVGDQGADQALGQAYWRELASRIAEELRSTDPERAIAAVVQSLGEKLRAHFPAEQPGSHEETSRT